MSDSSGTDSNNYLPEIIHDVLYKIFAKQIGVTLEITEERMV